MAVEFIYLVVPTGPEGPDLTKAQVVVNYEAAQCLAATGSAAGEVGESVLIYRCEQIETHTRR